MTSSKAAFTSSAKDRSLEELDPLERREALILAVAKARRPVQIRRVKATDSVSGHLVSQEVSFLGAAKFKVPGLLWTRPL